MAKMRILALTYRTFPATLSTVRDATVEALKGMGLRVSPQMSPPDHSPACILASGRKRELHVELEPFGPAETRARIFAKDGLVYEDSAARDLIARVLRCLERRAGSAAPGRAARTSMPVAVVTDCSGAVFAN